ncbi:hypothetical protein [[Eubacterium] cellulosolvens]
MIILKGVIKVTSLWTKLTVLLLALDGVGSLFSIFVVGVSPLEMVIAIELVFVLAAISWMETKWGALLVSSLGIIMFVQSIIVSTFYLIPEYGPQWGQYLYSIIFLLISAFSYLSYRKITKLI